MNEDMKTRTTLRWTGIERATGEITAVEGDMITVTWLNLDTGKRGTDMGTRNEIADSWEVAL
jgi:hypothetical protein